MSSMLRYALLCLVLLTVGCVEGIEPAVDPPSPVVPRNPRIDVFRTSVRHFTEEVRVAANRFELGMSRSEAELLLDELKDRCSRIPKAPEPEFQATRDECVSLVRRLEATAERLIEIDTQRRLAERAANLQAMNVRLKADVPLATVPDWVPPAEWGTAIVPIQGMPVQVAAAPFDAMKADALRQGIADVRVQTEQLNQNIGGSPPLAGRDRTLPERPVLIR